MPTQFQQEWTLEAAMKVLQHPTVDSDLWAEAVEWLLLYGPAEIREILGQASSQALQAEFPEMKPLAYDTDGTPCYALEQLAQSLGISTEEAAAIIADKEEKHGQRHLVDPEETTRLQ
ncbi:hypothetical protein [Desulfogranum mediterraneum]|uniref:hypothetical protein n=1 Tax=Desulfogranum mediterraneum TaxID=160661 RepID=UPI0004124FC9|nr:hypothetical protein [Desulfogranum mediterraneum]